MRTPTDDRQGATAVIRMIAKDLRINPLRTSLTALSMFIGIIAFAAVLISAVLVWAIPWMMPADSPLEPPAYPYTAAMIAACASIVTSLVGSLAPAIKAIRLQPALALR